LPAPRSGWRDGSAMRERGFRAAWRFYRKRFRAVCAF
jgi:hypothetical protein